MKTSPDVTYPAKKRGDAEAIRQSNLEGGSSKPYLEQVIQVVNASPGCSTTAPITLFGVTTSEYCIAPCPDRDDYTLEIVHHLTGKGYYVERFRSANTEGEVNHYKHMLLIVWDRRILRKSVMPRYYRTKDGVRVPCGACLKQKSGDVATCEGCDTFRIWLAGKDCMNNAEDPCTICQRSKQSKGRVVCSTCPAKNFWIVKHPEAEKESGKAETATSVEVVSAESKSASASQGDNSGDTADSSADSEVK